MKKIILLLTLLCYCILAEAQQYSFVYDGSTRSYIVHLPAGYTPTGSYPLVLNFHGLTSNASQQQSLSGMNAVSDANNFIVVYPNGLNNSWNAGVNNANVDDVGFVNRLLDVLSGQYAVNAQRVYATGFSMGGYFSYRLACQLSNRFAAVAPVSGVMARSTTTDCAAVRSVPVMHIHGTSDNIVPYSGVASSLSYWRNQDGCTAAAQTTSLPNNVDLIVYGGCTQGAEVRHYRINGAGHTWPRTTINGSQEIWTFFNRFTLNAQTSNPAPVVSITAPVAGTSFTAPASISIAATATDANGTVAKVEFFQGSVKLGEDVTSPYTYSWTNVAAGTYALTAKATDNQGAVATSAAVTVSVSGTGGGITCAGVAAYSSSTSTYVVGSRVVSYDRLFECKSAARCNGSAWLYAPGVGSYWENAWEYQGVCPAARTAIVSEVATDAYRAPAQLDTKVSNIYPNPVTDKVLIDFDSPAVSEVHVSVTSMMAKNELNTTFQLQPGQNKLTFDVGQLQPGLHILTIIQGNERIVRRIEVAK